MIITMSRVKLGSLLAAGLSAVILTAGCAAGSGTQGVIADAHGVATEGQSPPKNAPLADATNIVGDPKVGCTGTGCNNTDPIATNCTVGARDTADLPDGGTLLGGFFELRYGPNCGTNWVRWTPPTNDHYRVQIGTLLSGGEFSNFVTVDDFNDKQGVQQYTNQVYAPGPVSVTIIDLDLPTSSPGYDGTYDQPIAEARSR